VVTYTGNGATSRNISHSLGSDPGCIIVKRTSGASSNWSVYHRSTGTGKRLILNQTSAVLTDADMFASVTSTTFSVSGNTDQNDNGETYVAYLFAHDAGGFGLTGTDNVISCGSFTTDGSGNATVTLGYEPQWVMIKRSDAADDWIMLDVMRGMSYSNCLKLAANASSAEYNFGANQTYPTATGFSTNGTLSASGTYIYIAIRRGPMKTPTTGTSVFSPVTYTTPTGNTSVNVGFPADMVFALDRNGPTINNDSRLVANSLQTSSTAAAVGTNYFSFTTAQNVVYDQLNYNVNCVMEAFRRAPGFFDVVCYTGNSTARTISHNLSVVPEMMILKSRSHAANWLVYHAAMGNTKYFRMNTSDAVLTATVWNDTTPTSTVFSVGSGATENGNAYNYVWYGFASCPGVSKVGSYTGTGTTLQIDCGFTGGARFVLIKRTDSTGDWYCWDSSRGIVSGNDSYLVLNSTAAEVTNTDYVDTYSAGFEISSTAPAAINANGGTFVFLAVA
jgi:hypothetical protein